MWPAVEPRFTTWPRPRGEHVRQDRPRDVEQALEIGVDHPVPVVRVAFLEGREAGRETGVIDQHVRHRAGGDERVHRGVHGCAVPHIDPGDVDRHAAGTELRLELLEPIEPPRPEDEMRPVRGEPPGARGADARARASDQDQLPGDAAHATALLNVSA